MSSHADMGPAHVQKFCALDDPCQTLMKTTMPQLQLTARAYHRVLKLGCMIADLAGSDAISWAHLEEALQYRPKIDLMNTSFEKLSIFRFLIVLSLIKMKMFI